ncbi:hypothetical protein Hanom_Chr16g01499191 [Helianthus anomalus]
MLVTVSIVYLTFCLVLIIRFRVANQKLHSSQSLVVEHALQELEQTEKVVAAVDIEYCIKVQMVVGKSSHPAWFSVIEYTDFLNV